MKLVETIPPPEPPKTRYIIELDEDEMERLFALSWFFEGDVSLHLPDGSGFFPGDDGKRLFSLVPSWIRERFFAKKITKACR